MPVDYSKWDNLELSDDSDIEVHPNVDKRSFIRAKQTQIHQERQQRRHHITTLKYERIINDGLLLRIDRLLTALKSHKVASSQSADELVLQSLIESAGDPADDTPPTPPEGVHQNTEETPRYSKMMASLVDQVKKDVDESKVEDKDRLEEFIKGITGHRNKVDGLQKELFKKLDELELVEKRHITSEDLHTGFDYSNVSKNNPSASTANPSASKAVETVELINPSRPSTSRTDTGQTSGADADIEDGPPGASSLVDDDTVEASKLGKAFARLPTSDFPSMLRFISANPAVLAERETDGLLVEAFNAQLDGADAHARACVHQALLLQYCRQLGRDGVGLFFKRITTREHQAQKLFYDDVNSTHARIRARAREINDERERERAEGGGNGGAEQIQLHAVDPNTQINISVPPRVADADSSSEDNERLKAARAIFESFPPGLQRALESGTLDEVNRVLGKMSVEEAEEVVELLGRGGMLSLEEGVIDATTEEGRLAMEEIERTGRMPGVGGEGDVEVPEGLARDPE